MASGVYHWLARYYDHLFEARRSFTSAHKVMLKPLLRNLTAACDLCCGTGDLAMEFARKGIETYAVDLSPEMCAITRNKSLSAGLDIRVIQADMRRFRLPRPVQLITCEYDALNHLRRAQDLPRVLQCVSRALEPGGFFLFDVNNRRAFEGIWSQTWFVERAPVALVMHGGHVPGTDHAWTDLEWFIREGDAWQRHHERVEEVCWPAPVMRQALRDAGFDRIETWDAAPFFNDTFTKRGNRTFWRARKAPIPPAGRRSRVSR